jgi:hypothetical protein
MKKKNIQKRCFDRIDKEIIEGSIVSVQMAGDFKVYKKEDNQLYFTPYGKEDMVFAYFRNDLELVEQPNLHPVFAQILKPFMP